MAGRGMTRRRALAVSALAGVALGAAGALVYRAGAVFAAGPGSANPPDLAEGARLYAETCASCHGADLEGQPDWRAPGPDGLYPAPPHDQTGHTWHHSDRVLFNYTKTGGAALLADQGVAFDSGMPGFGDELSDDEILSVLAERPDALGLAVPGMPIGSPGMGPEENRVTCSVRRIGQDGSTEVFARYPGN